MITWSHKDHTGFPNTWHGNHVDVQVTTVKLELIPCVGTNSLCKLLLQ